MLDIVPGYNPVQYQGQPMIQNGKKPNFGPNFGSLRSFFVSFISTSS